MILATLSLRHHGNDISATSLIPHLITPGGTGNKDKPALFNCTLQNWSPPPGGTQNFPCFDFSQLIKVYVWVGRRKASEAVTFLIVDVGSGNKRGADESDKLGQTKDRLTSGCLRPRFSPQNQRQEICLEI